MANSWFKYDGSGSITDPQNYNQVAALPNCPSPDVNICAIFANTQFIAGVARPIITPALQTEINNAFSSKIESANVRLQP